MPIRSTSRTPCIVTHGAHRRLGTSLQPWFPLTESKNRRGDPREKPTSAIPPRLWLPKIPKEETWLCGCCRTSKNNFAPAHRPYICPHQVFKLEAQPTSDPLHFSPSSPVPFDCPASRSLALVALVRAMSDHWGPPWSGNPYAPQIPYWLYLAEKTNFAGFLIGAIFYGTHQLTRLLKCPHLPPLFYHSRDRYRSVLPMYGCPAQFRQSHEQALEMGPRNPHCGHVLVCDDIHRD